MPQLDVFSEEWCKEWKDRLNRNADFAKYNKGWEGDLSGIIQADPDNNFPEERYLYLHFHDGSALDIKMITREAAEKCKFIMSGPYMRWYQVAKGDLDAVKAMMQGKLKLKGNLPYVVKYVKGVQESIKTMQSIDTKFPNG
ncbi:MAG: SCP2 sterol-binding domain-containing protein [bacterium]